MKNESIKILLVDDEPDILEIVGYHLKKEGYRIFKAGNGREAVDKARTVEPHLILLDIMMPEMNGMDACKSIRKIKGLENVLIAFFTARGEDFSQVAGFDAGADDYITKPVKPKVLISKVKGLLRRLNKRESNEKRILSFEGITINKDQYFVKINQDKITLPRKEFELLNLLASEPNKVFNRETILKIVWGHDVVVGGRTIDVHVRKLREKIGDKYIQTLKGVGYKFVV